MMRHVACVKPVEGRGGLSAQYRAVCDCGWRGKVVSKRGGAQMDAVAHVVGHKPVPKPAATRPAATRRR